MLATAVTRVFYLALMFITGLVLSNLLLPAFFGTVSLIILNASLFSIVISLGTDTMLLYKVSNGEWEQARAAKFTRMTIAVQLFLFLVAECVSLVVWHKTLLSNEGPDYLLLDIVYFTGLLLTEKYIALLYALHRARIANVLLAVCAFIYLALLVVVPLLKDADVQTVMGLFAGQSLVQGLVLLVFYHVNQRTAVKGAISWIEFFGLLKMSSIVMITNLIQLLAYRLDFWMIQFFWGKYDVGIYAQANKFANLCWLLPNIFSQLLLPKFAKLERDQTLNVFSTAFYFNVVLLLLTLVSTHLLYSYYLKSEYSTGLAAFHMMLPGYFFWASVIYFGAFMSSAGRFSDNLVCSSVCFVLILLSDVALIPLYGMEGAALGNTISYTVVFFLYLYILNRKFSFSLKGMFRLRKNALTSIFKFVDE